MKEKKKGRHKVPVGRDKWVVKMSRFPIAAC
jgi:hypothetical protein